MEQHRGTTVLVLGILGLVGVRVCGIIAWVMANKDNAKMLAGTMDPAGLQQTKGGKICGIISVVLILVDIILIFAYHDRSRCMAQNCRIRGPLSKCNIIRFERTRRLAF